MFEGYILFWATLLLKNLKFLESKIFRVVENVYF